MTTIRTILKLLTVSISVFLLIFFISCNGNDGCDNYPKGGKKYIEFHAEDSLKIPYTGTDTLTFLRTIDSTVKDTVVFIGQGKKYYKEWLRFENEESDCEYSVSAMGYTIDYVAEDEPDLKFIFRVKAAYGMTDEISVIIRDLQFNIGFWLWEQSTGYYENITFNGKTYKSVVEHVGKYNSFTDLMYYNFQFGIIRFYFNDGVEIMDLITD